ncbi:MAG: hypothetical protein ACRD23_18500 [Terriglobales bacterium]
MFQEPLAAIHAVIAPKEGEIVITNRLAGRNDVLRFAMASVILAKEKTSHVLFSDRQLCGQWSSGRRWRRHFDEGKA